MLAAWGRWCYLRYILGTVVEGVDTGDRNVTETNVQNPTINNY